MRLWVTFCTLWLSWLIALAKADEYKVVCYFGSWAVYRTGNGKIEISDIDPTLCTHLIYSFVGATDDGEVSILDPWSDLPDDGGKAGFEKFNALRKLSAGTKTLAAIGGWNEESLKYSNIVADDSLRSKFVESIVNFVHLYEFDGFDIDWEYPGQRGGSQADLVNYVLFVKELREVFDEHDLILSAAVAAAESSASLSYDIPEISKYLHFINLMTYDFHGSWDSTTGHNAPLYPAERETTESDRSLNVNATVHYWLSQGAPAEKLILGTGFYGRSFTLENSAQNVPGSPAIGAGVAGPYTQESGMLGYNEICEQEVQGYWTSAWDDVQHVPYAHAGDQWVSYDNVESLTEKANYVKALGLGGAMVWSIETDDFRGICGESYPLLKALNRVLRDETDASSPISSSESSTSSEPADQTTSGSVAEPAAPAETPEVAEVNAFPEISDSEEEETGDSDQESTVICNSAGFVKDPQDCAKFWYCQPSGDGFIATSFTCPNGLYFDPNYNVCNYASLVEC